MFEAFGVLIIALLISIGYGGCQHKEAQRLQEIVNSAKAVGKSADTIEREKEKAIESAVKQATAKASEDVAKAKSDLATSNRNLAGLRATLANLNSRPASADPAVTAERETTATVGNLFSLCSERYTMLGSSADEARNRGKLCEGIADANQSIRAKVEALK